MPPVSAIASRSSVRADYDIFNFLSLDDKKTAVSSSFTLTAYSSTLAWLTFFSLSCFFYCNILQIVIVRLATIDRWERIIFTVRAILAIISINSRTTILSI